jgi:hypothetical protein
MNKTLGITLNYNCVSWALTDDQRANPILSMGVRVFPTTINHLGSGINEESQLQYEQSIETCVGASLERNTVNFNCFVFLLLIKCVLVP